MTYDQKKIICIGSMGKDIFFPMDPKRASHETQCSTSQIKWFSFEYGSKIHIEDRYNALGGCACNVSIGLARLGIHVSACGNVGNDAEGRWVMQVLEEENVRVKNVRVIDDVKTDLSVIFIDSTVGERTIFVNRDVGEQLRIDQQDISDAQWCYVSSLYGKYLRDNMRVLHDAVTRGRIQLAYNPGGNNIKNDTDIVLDLIHHARVVFVNLAEAQDIVAHFSEAARKNEEKEEIFLLRILHQHMKNDDSIVVLTDGSKGAWVCNGATVFHTETRDKVIKDTTGAGDAFASGFVGALLHGCTMEECIQWGCANSDAVIDEYGAQKGLLQYDIIQKAGRLFTVKKII